MNISILSFSILWVLQFQKRKNLDKLIYTHTTLNKILLSGSFKPKIKQNLVSAVNAPYWLNSLIIRRDFLFYIHVLEFQHDFFI